MKQLNNYIFEKLKIDKNIKLSNNQYYFIAIWTGNLLDTIKHHKKYSLDLFRAPGYVPGVFVKEEEIQDIINLVTNKDQIRNSIRGIFKVPIGYDYDSFTNEYLKNKNFLADLEKIDIKDYV